MTHTSNHISVKYQWLRQNVVKNFVIRKIESENKKACIIAKVIQGGLFVSIRTFLWGW